MSEENRRQTAKELLIQPGSTSTSTWYKPPDFPAMSFVFVFEFYLRSTRYKPPEAEAGEHYYKVMIVEGPKKTFKPAKVNYSKEIAKQNPRNSKARRAILDR